MQANFKTMVFHPARAKTCVCFLSKNDYWHTFKTGEDAIGNKWRAIADDCGAIVYVEMKPAKRLHKDAFERS